MAQVEPDVGRTTGGPEGLRRIRIGGTVLVEGVAGKLRDLVFHNRCHAGSIVGSRIDDVPNCIAASDSVPATTAHEGVDLAAESAVANLEQGRGKWRLESTWYGEEPRASSRDPVEAEMRNSMALP